MLIRKEFFPERMVRVTVWCACASDAQRWKMDLCYLSLFLSSSLGDPSVADKLVTQDRQQKPAQPLVPQLSLYDGGVCFWLMEPIFLPGVLSPMTWDKSAPRRSLLRSVGTGWRTWTGNSLRTQKVLTEIHISPGGKKSSGWKIRFYLLLTLLACYCLGLCCAKVWFGQVPLWGLGHSSCLFSWLDFD